MLHSTLEFFAANSESGKLVFQYIVSEVGYDKSQNNEQFPLYNAVKNVSKSSPLNKTVVMQNMINPIFY